MKKHIAKTKLFLHTETVRNLQSRELANVAGGAESENSCYPCGSNGCITHKAH